ncbi:MAG: hypothetical protein ACRCVT_12475 [Leadbetterella sp.]
MIRIISFFLLLSISGFSQDFKKNHLKLNVSGAVLKIAGIQYERAFSERWSLCHSIAYRPKSTLTFPTLMDSLAKQYGEQLIGYRFQYLDISNAKTSMISYVPELRYFAGKNKKIILSAYLRVQQLKTNVPATIPFLFRDGVYDVTLPVDIDLVGILGGFSIGKRFTWNNAVLDFILIGGSAGVSLNYNVYLDGIETERLSNEGKEFALERMEERFGVSKDKFETSFLPNSVEAKSYSSSPLFGIKGLQINFGWRF